jgi:hypothetical protein
MNEWSKLYEALTKPLPAVSALFLALFTSILLFGPPQFVRAIGLASVLESYRWIPGLLFLVAICWLIIILTLPLGRWVHNDWKNRQQEKRLHKRLGRLAADERHLLGWYVKDARRTQTWSGEYLGTAQGLADDGILYRPQLSQAVTTGVPYNIVEAALDYLSKNPDLVAESVPSNRPA